MPKIKTLEMKFSSARGSLRTTHKHIVNLFFSISWVPKIHYKSSQQILFSAANKVFTLRWSFFSTCFRSGKNVRRRSLLKIKSCEAYSLSLSALSKSWYFLPAEFYQALRKRSRGSLSSLEIKQACFISILFFTLSLAHTQRDQNFYTCGELRP